MQFQDSEIKATQCVPESAVGVSHASYTAEHTAYDIAVQVVKHKDAGVYTESTINKVVVYADLDISVCEPALLRLQALFETQPCEVTIKESDHLYRYNYCSFVDYLGHVYYTKLVMYCNGRINVLLPGRCVDIFPFYVQKRNLQSYERKFATVYRPTAFDFPIIGYENGAISLDGKLMYSFAVDEVICVRRLDYYVVSFDRIGRVSVYDGEYLSNALILRDKRTKREFEEGNYLCDAYVLDAKSGLVTAATAQRDGQIAIFSFSCKRSAAIEQITQLTDAVGAGYRQLAQFSVIPGDIRIKLLGVHYNTPLFMYQSLKTCCLVKNGMGELRLYCCGREICGYQAQDVADFQYALGSVVVLTRSRLLCFPAYSKSQVVQPYFEYYLDYVYDKCVIVSTGEKSICFLSSQTACEIREIGIRFYNFKGDAVYRDVSGV